MEAWIITLVCLTLFALGLPIVLTMALWAAAISYLVVDLSLANFGQNAWYGLENFAFLALPLFIVTGDLVLAGGIARHLAGFANALVGWIRGGLAMATIMACGFFAAISGSNAATTATIGSIMIPEMNRRGYDRVFAAATAAAGGTVGVIIPPSIIYIVYGIIMNVSPVDLFVAGIVPGIFMVLFMMLAVGTVFESVPNVIMTAPILAPAAYAVGIDPIQFAMIFLLGDTLGFITWPYGLNLFVASSLTGIPYMKISYRALWYCAA